jgi:hypothetical protein
MKSYVDEALGAYGHGTSCQFDKGHNSSPFGAAFDDGFFPDDGNKYTDVGVVYSRPFTTAADVPDERSQEDYLLLDEEEALADHDQVELNAVLDERADLMYELEPFGYTRAQCFNMSIDKMKRTLATERQQQEIDKLSKKLHELGYSQKRLAHMPLWMMKKFVAKERRQHKELKSLGYSEQNIRKMNLAQREQFAGKKQQSEAKARPAARCAKSKRKRNKKNNQGKKMQQKKVIRKDQQLAA